MSNACASLPTRGRNQLVLAVTLAIAIIFATALPGPGSTNARSLQTIFTLMEGDYHNPVLSSAGAIRVLNVAAKHIGRFAGYDELRARVDFNETSTVANVTRFSGDLLAMLNVRLELKERLTNIESIIYISESFWERAFSRSPDIIGAPLRVNQTVYRIAGVALSPANFLQNTELWIPVSGRGKLRDLNAFRVIATLLVPENWRSAQREIGLTFQQRGLRPDDAEFSTAKLIPLVNRISFGEAAPVVASRWSSGPMSGS